MSKMSYFLKVVKIRCSKIPVNFRRLEAPPPDSRNVIPPPTVATISKRVSSDKRVELLPVSKKQTIQVTIANVPLLFLPHI